MRILASTAAAASLALGMAAFTALPAAATTASEARCADARGSGSLTEIRLHCNEPELADPVTTPGTVVRGMLFNNTVGSDVSDARMNLRDMNCMQARNENSQANIAFFCS